ncbi:MAG: thiol-disulfide oxidoreductase DCC family protein [Bacteroidota bacterium]
MEKSENIILFDGICNLCNGIVKFIIKRDSKRTFKFASLQSETGQSFLFKFGLNPIFFQTIIYIRDNSYFIESAAVLNILKDLGSGWKMFYVLIVIPKFIRDFFYRIISKTRYKIFGKCKTCIVPTPDIKDRFLEW